VRMLGTTFPLTVPDRALDDAELQVLDFRGEVIGTYHIGQVDVVRILESDLSEETDLELSFRGHFLPFPYAREVWRRWSSGGPIQFGEWRQLPQEWRSSWLHVVQTAWFCAGRMATR